MSAERKLGLVLDGGGARAAYQVGLLRFLASEIPELRTPILTGVSAGAINTAHLASRRGSFRESVDELARLWNEITVDHVFRVDTWGLLCSVLNWGVRLLSGGSADPAKARGLTDTDPLREVLGEALLLSGGRLVGVEDNLERGVLDAVAMTTTNYGTGQSNTWVQGRNVELWTRPHRRAIACELTLDHVMASAALPLLFPAVSIGDEWHGDGGIRLTAPLSPALHLGAGRILAISTRHVKEPTGERRSMLRGYPPPAHVIGVLMNAIFLDMIEYDAANMARINRLLESVPEEERGSLRPVEILTMRPSQDLGRLSGEFEAKLPRAFRFLTRGWGTRETESPDFLSMLMFQEDYLARVIELGEQDARARADELLPFVQGE